MPKKLIIAVVAGIVLVAGIVVGVLFFLRRGGSTPFEDVPKDYFYSKEIAWAVKKGIVDDSDSNFYPDDVCTRGQAMTFLWKASGSPEPSPNFLNPFPDVPSAMYYHDAVLWAAEQRITHGDDYGAFWPDGPITRGQAIVFIYRAVGSPDVDWDKELPFWDVTSTDYFEAAVRWAIDEKITTGIADNVFLPHDPCTRAQMVTFLYRCFK